MSLAGFPVAGDGPLFEQALILNRSAGGATCRGFGTRGNSVQINRI